MSQTEKTKQQEIVEKLFNNLLVRIIETKQKAHELNHVGNKLLKANTELSSINPRDGYNLEELLTLKRYVDLSRQIEIDLAKYEDYFIEKVEV